jgi:hypothetical protein
MGRPRELVSGHDGQQCQIPDLRRCDEEIRNKKGASIGLVVVGPIDPNGLRHFLTARYEDKELIDSIETQTIQLTRNNHSKGIEVLLRYPAMLNKVNNDQELKKLWAFYLVQTMAENRFKRATLDVDGKWICPEESKYLLPTLTTVAHGIERFWTPNNSEDRLLKKYLTTMQTLKQKGFTENELADFKSQLMKHLHRFYDTKANVIMLADYYISHIAALSETCPSYKDFMKTSLEVVPEIKMGDIADILKTSFKDGVREVTIQHPNSSTLNEVKIEEVLKQSVTDALEFKYEESVKMVEQENPFVQLPISQDEEKMIREIIQTVGEKSAVSLFLIKSELEDKRKRLVHIHPLRSIAVMITDSYTKRCLAEILDDKLKRGNFIDDYNKRFNREAERDNLQSYLLGFCQTVKANPDQVRSFVQARQWEMLIRYLLKL